jgi:hypothetical protein
VTPRIACVIVAHERRRDLVHDVVVPSLLSQSELFDEMLVVEDWHEKYAHRSSRVQWLYVPPLTRSTNDALVKRDVGALATAADVVVYLCDDHALDRDFAAALRAVADEPWDVLVPNRWTKRPGGRIALNNGEPDDARNASVGGYCGGHAGVFRRWVIQRRPWSTMPHHRLWDLLASVVQHDELGATFCWRPRADLAVYDIEPNAQPWL